jgi:hypothetical protein
MNETSACRRNKKSRLEVEYLHKAEADADAYEVVVATLNGVESLHANALG